MADIVKLEKKRLSFLIVIFLILFLLITARLIKLVVFDNTIKLTKPKTQTIYERGQILDCNYKKLAVSLKVYSLFCHPTEITNINSGQIKKISSILKIRQSDLKKKINSDKKFVWIKRQIDHSILKRVLNLKIDGLEYLREYKRFYPNNHLCSHVLGITGIDNVGLEGLELYYDKFLNASFKADNEKKKYNLILSIDKNIQYIAESELERTIKETKAKRGTVLIMEPSTGYILAMAVYPDFDPNSFGKYSQKRRQNQAILNIFEPGSIFKIFSSAAVYSENTIKESDIFKCPGHILIGKDKISCWKSHGELNFHRVIKESCNVGMIKAILKISRFKFYNYLLNFGIGNYTGIDIPGEARGLLRKPKGMGLFSHAAISLGQEVGTTAIQLITAGCSIYNNGKLMEPKIVKAIVEDDGTLYREFKPIIIRQAVLPSIANKIKHDLKGVVEEGGTGELAYIKGYSIGGKTGTGEVYDKRERQYDKERVNSSFIGFFPADNARYGILVTIHEPKTIEKAGGKIAAPLFKKIVEKILSYKAIPNKDQLIVPGKANGSIKIPSQKINRSKSDEIPGLLNKNMREVINILKSYNVKKNLIGTGISYKQSPEEGEPVEQTTVITVWFKEP